MRKWVLVLAVMGAGILGAAPGSGPGKWGEVLRQLGSADFAVREAGQKALAGAGWGEIGVLRTLAAGAGDAEVRARLMRRVGELEEAAALDPPPITLHIHDGEPSDVAEALTKATGVKWGWVNNGLAASHYNLDAVDEPLWDVVLKLSRQSPLVLRGWDEMSLWRQEPGTVNGVRVGGYLFAPELLVRLTVADPQQLPGPKVMPSRLAFTYAMMVDPRMQVIRRSWPSLTSVVDDHGNVLCAEKPRITELRDSEQETISEEARAELKVFPESTRIVSAKGTVRCVVQTVGARAEIDLAKWGAAPVMIGDKVVVFSNYEATAQQVRLQVNVSAGSDEAKALLGDSVRLRLLDGAGGVLQASHVRGHVDISIDRPVKLPVMAIVSGPVKAQVVDMPFEFKDLPLP